jgi:hypothetical protein
VTVAGGAAGLRGADQRPQRLHDAFPGQILTRLRELNAAYDPENVFDQNFPIASVLPDWPKEHQGRMPCDAEPLPT